jgi:hypothetical protein
MAFLPGNPGKPKGAVSKINSKFAQTMNEHGVDLAYEMLDSWNRAMASKDEKLAFSILSEMASYVYPKLKAVEVSTSTSHMSKQEKIEALKAMLESLEKENG